MHIIGLSCNFQSCVCFSFTPGKSSCPDVSTLVQSLQQALALEAKFQPKLQLLSTASNTGVSIL
jgi:cyclin G2